MAIVVTPVSKASPFPVGTDRRDRETTARLIQAQAPLLTVSVPGLPAISAPTAFMRVTEVLSTAIRCPSPRNRYGPPPGR